MIWNTPRAQKLLDVIERHKQEDAQRARQTSGVYQQRSSGSTGLVAQHPGMGAGTAAVVTCGREGLTERQMEQEAEEARIAAEAATKARRLEMQKRVAHLRQEYWRSRGQDRKYVAVQAAYILNLPTDDAALLEIGKIMSEEQ